MGAGRGSSGQWVGDRRLDHEFHHRVPGDGRTVQNALRDFASPITKPGRDVRLLRTLGDCRHVERVRQVDDRADDRFGARIGQHVADQLVVDLDFVNGQLA